MPWLRTAALSLNLHAGVHVEPEHLGGLSGLVCEMIQRGAGKYSSRDLVAVQDNRWNRPQLWRQYGVSLIRCRHAKRIAASGNGDLC